MGEINMKICKKLRKSCFGSEDRMGQDSFFDIADEPGYEAPSAYGKSYQRITNYDTHGNEIAYGVQVGRRCMFPGLSGHFFFFRKPKAEIGTWPHLRTHFWVCK